MDFEIRLLKVEGEEEDVVFIIQPSFFELRELKELLKAEDELAKQNFPADMIEGPESNSTSSQESILNELVNPPDESPAGK